MFTHHISLFSLFYVMGCNEDCNLFVCCEMYKVVPDAATFRSLLEL